MTLDLGRAAAASRTSVPRMPTDPADPAYDWSRYDRAIERREQPRASQVLLTIVGTPAWANGGQRPAATRRASATTLRAFAYAAARRYSGTFLDTAAGGCCRG